MVDTKNLNDSIFIERLAVDVLIGVADWERKRPRKLILDIKLGFPIRETDNLEDTLNYSEIAKKIKSLVKDQEFHLLEKVATTICSSLLDTYSINWISITVRKPFALLDAESAGVNIVRYR